MGSTGFDVRYAVSLGKTVRPFDGLIAWLPGDGDGEETVTGTQATWNGTEAYTAGRVADAFAVAGGSHVSLPLEHARPVHATSVGPRRGSVAAEIHGRALDRLGSERLTEIELDGSGNYRLNAGYSDASWLLGPATDYFQHIAVTFDGENLATFLNGERLQSDYWTGALELGFQILNVGIDRDGYQPFHGAIDEIQVFNRALSDAEIQETFFAGASGLHKNHAPEAVAAALPNPAEATGPNGATVVLDGRGSSDPNGARWPIPGATNRTPSAAPVP